MTRFSVLALVCGLGWGALACGGGAAGSGEPAQSASDVEAVEATAEDPPAPGECRATTFTFDEVKAACEEGGVKQAQALMKDYVKQAKAAGQKVKCTSCHSNQKTYELTDNAVEDLRALLQ